MNLIDAAARCALPRCPYRMRFLIVAQVVEVNLAAAAERIISRISSSYATCGGTNAVFAGLSNASAESGEKPFYIACKDFGPLVERSTTAEMKIVDKQLQDTETVIRTRLRRKELDDLQRKYDGELGRQREAEKDIQSLEDKFDDLAPAWGKVVDTELRAVHEHEKVINLYQRMLDVFKGTGRQTVYPQTPRTPGSVRTQRLQMSQLTQYSQYEVRRPTPDTTSREVEVYEDESESDQENVERARASRGKTDASTEYGDGNKSDQYDGMSEDEEYV